jgi:hypothetical protein
LGFHASLVPTSLGSNSASAQFAAHSQCIPSIANIDNKYVRVLAGGSKYVFIVAGEQGPIEPNCEPGTRGIGPTEIGDEPVVTTSTS